MEKKMEKNNRFLTIEGGDGAGKSSVMRALVFYLEERGFSVIPTREPGGSVLGEKIREVVLFTQKEAHISPLAELLLFLSARAQHVESLIRPSLEAGKFVLCDRFHDSTLAYQAGGRGLDRNLVEELSLTSAGGLVPGITLYLDTDPTIGLERARKRHHMHGDTPDRIEMEQISFHERVRQTFLDQAQKDPERVHILDAGQPLEKVIADAVGCIEKWVTQNSSV